MSRIFHPNPVFAHYFDDSHVEAINYDGHLAEKRHFVPSNDEVPSGFVSIKFAAEINNRIDHRKSLHGRGQPPIAQATDNTPFNENLSEFLPTNGIIILKQGTLLHRAAFVSTPVKTYSRSNLERLLLY
jgi:hypothetical protein